MVKKKVGFIIITITTIGILIWWTVQAQMIVRWNKQTVYLSVLNAMHFQAENAVPQILLIDDDSNDGIFIIKRICDDVGIKASFAVIPKRMSPKVIDSLSSWQQQGFGIALHGYNHDKWEQWTENKIRNDIIISKKRLFSLGFDTCQIKIVVPPFGYNTKSIRSAISSNGCKMITGGALMNPDKEVFQMGRFFLTKHTDERLIQMALDNAKLNNWFVILGTHSSDSLEFSEEITTNILKYAKKLVVVTTQHPMS